MIKIKAFSLIELLITLIIISLLVGAFAPIITKKLKASDITVGSFSQGGSNLELKNNAPKSQTDCDKFNALFIPASMNDGTNNICVTRYNIGDNTEDGGVAVSGHAQELSVGQTCSLSGNCCWKGQTANPCTTNNNSISYSGCTRTVCQWKAADLSCAQYAPNGSKAGYWRLPNSAEAQGWIENFATLQIAEGKNGLQLCSDNGQSRDGMNGCMYINEKCIGSPYGSCRPGYTWLSEKTTSTTHASMLSSVDKKIWRSDDNLAISARCVYDGLNDYTVVQKPDEEEPEIKAKEPQSQADCDKVALYTMFIEKKYNDGYKNVCVTKFNVGDPQGPDIAASVVNFQRSKYTVCPKASESLCCWNGRMGAYCTDDGNYSGCTRTVCQWEAARRSCLEWNSNDKYKGYWRLPKRIELNGWARNINYISRGRGNNGLQFCDDAYSKQDTVGSVSGSAVCFGIDECKNTFGDSFCEPMMILSMDSVNENTKYAYYLRMNSFTEYTFHKNTRGFSARCVYDGDDYSGELD